MIVFPRMSATLMYCPASIAATISSLRDAPWATIARNSMSAVCSSVGRYSAEAGSWRTIPDPAVGGASTATSSAILV